MDQDEPGLKNCHYLGKTVNGLIDVWSESMPDVLPIATTDPVTCGACQHYTPDPIGHGGIGTCRANRFLENGGQPLYPRATRYCNASLNQPGEIS